MMSRRFFAALVMQLVVLAPTLGDDLFEPANEPPYFRPERMVPFYADESENDKTAIASKPLKYWVERLLHEEASVRKLATEMIHNEYSPEGIWDTGFFSDKEIEYQNEFRAEHKSLAPVLLQILERTEDGEVFAYAASLLAALGPEARAFLPDLRRLAIEPKMDGQNRMMAVLALLFVTPEDQAVGPICLNYLKGVPKETLNQLYADDSEDFMRASVGLSIPLTAGMLIRSGHTKVEVPHLVQVAQGDYPAPLRAVTILTLGALELDAKAAIPALHTLLKDKNRYIRACAASALLDIEQDKALVPVIIEAIGLEGKEREECEEGCKEFFADKVKEQKSLSEIGEDDEFVLPTLIAMLKHGNGFYRRQAIRDLGTVGKAANSALPDLRKSLNDSDEETRKLAADAIEKIEKSMANSSKN